MRFPETDYKARLIDADGTETIVSVPASVANNQHAWAEIRKPFLAIHGGHTVDVWLDGKAYDLGGPGTGDMIVRRHATTPPVRCALKRTLYLTAAGEHVTLGRGHLAEDDERVVRAARMARTLEMPGCVVYTVGDYWSDEKLEVIFPKWVSVPPAVKLNGLYYFECVRQASLAH